VLARLGDPALDASHGNGGLRLFLGRLGLAQASNGAVKFMDLGANPFTLRFQLGKTVRRFRNFVFN